MPSDTVAEMYGTVKTSDRYFKNEISNCSSLRKCPNVEV